MLLVIHNLPAQIPYKEIKELIATKCGIRDMVLDQLQAEGTGSRVTVGVMEDEDAAMLVRKLNEVYHRGHLLYVEDKRQKRQAEQPYRQGAVPPSQAQSQVQPQQQYTMQQQPQYDMTQAPPMPLWPNQMAGYMYQGPPNNQAVQNAYMMYGQQYTEAMMSQYSGTTNQYNQQGYGQQVNDPQNDNQQNYDQDNYNRQGFNTQNENSYARRSDNQDRSNPIGERNPRQSRWGQEKSKDNRRRPASPQMSAWAQNAQEPKRAKLESDRSERPYERRDRFQEDGGNNSRSTGLDNQKNVKKGWWGKEGDRDTHVGRPDGRTSPFRHDKNNSYKWIKPNERDLQSQRPDRRDPPPGPYQSDCRDPPPGPYQSDRRDPPPGPYQSDRRDPPPGPYQSDRRDPPPGPYQSDHRDPPPGPYQSDRRHPPPGPYQSDRRDPPPGPYQSDRRDPPPGPYQSNRRGPPHGPSQANRRDPPHGASQPARRGFSTTPLHTDRYEPNDGSASPVQEKEWEIMLPKLMSVEKFMKRLKIKSMRRIMTDTIQNIKQIVVFRGRCPIKIVMKKVILARINDLVGDAKMLPEEIDSSYRNLYPEQGDALLFSRLLKTSRAKGGFGAVNMKEYFQTFVLNSGPRPKPQLSYGKSKGIGPGSQKPQQHMASKAPGYQKPQQQIDPTAPVYQMPQKQGPPKGPGNKQQIAGPQADTKTSRKESRLNNYMLVKLVTFEIVKNLNLHEEMAEPSPFRTLMRKAIFMRVADIVQGLTSDPVNILSDYRQKYPASDDAELLAEVRKAVKDNPNITFNIVKEFGRQSVKNPKKIVRPVKPVPVVAPAPPAPKKIPNYPGGDKKLHMQQKKLHKLERTLLESYTLDDDFQKAVDEEVGQIGKLIENLFADPQTEEQKIVYANVNKPVTVNACLKFLSFHISKRLRNGGLKMARIFGHPKPPKKHELEAFLSKYRCITLKKSVRSVIYMATFPSFEAIDRLCAMGPIPIGSEGISITVKYMHVAPTKHRPGVDHWKNLRKKYISSLIDNSRVNLLSKNWQNQDKAEKEARANQLNAVLEDAAKDVVPVGNEVKDDVHEIEDDDTNIEEKEQVTEVTESGNDGFLHKDFKVIDEVGDNEEPAPTNDNIVDDDWDQTGEDWGDDTDNAGDNKIDKNTVKGDSAPGETNKADDENAVGEGNDADDDQPDDGAGDSVQFAEDIDIADVDFDNIDAGDLEDY